MTPYVAFSRIQNAEFDFKATKIEGRVNQRMAVISNKRDIDAHKRRVFQSALSARTMIQDKGTTLTLKAGKPLDALEDIWDKEDQIQSYRIVGGNHDSGPRSKHPKGNQSALSMAMGLEISRSQSLVSCEGPRSFDIRDNVCRAYRFRCYPAGMACAI